MEHVGRKTRHADDQMRARLGFGIEADARLQIEEGADSAAVERLDLRILQRAADLAFAFGLEHEAIDVAAIPGLGIPDIAVLRAIGRKPGFEPFDEDFARDHAAVLARELAAGGRHGRAAPDRVGGMLRPFERTPWQGIFGRRAGSRLFRHAPVRAMIHPRHRVVHGLRRRVAFFRWTLFGRQVSHRAVVHLRLRPGVFPVLRMVLRGERRGHQHGPG